MYTKCTNKTWKVFEVSVRLGRIRSTKAKLVTDDNDFPLSVDFSNRFLFTSQNQYLHVWYVSIILVDQTRRTCVAGTAVHFFVPSVAPFSHN